MIFIDSSGFIVNILVLKYLKMLFFKQNSTFEQTQFWTVRVVYFEIFFI